MNKNLRIGLVVAVALGVLGACGGDDEELPTVDCTGTVPKYDDVAAFDKCVTCHSSELSGSARKDAPADVNFDTESAARKNAEKAAEEVNGGAMPPPSSGIKLTNEEKDDLYKWALCD